MRPERFIIFTLPGIIVPFVFPKVRCGLRQLSSTSPDVHVLIVRHETTEPTLSPSAIIGYTTEAIYLSIPSIMGIRLFSVPFAKAYLSSMIFSISLEIFFSEKSFRYARNSYNVILIRN